MFKDIHTDNPVVFDLSGSMQEAHTLSPDELACLKTNGVILQPI